MIRSLTLIPCHRSIQASPVRGANMHACWCVTSAPHLHMCTCARHASCYCNQVQARRREAAFGWCKRAAVVVSGHRAISTACGSHARPFPCLQRLACDRDSRVPWACFADLARVRRSRCMQCGVISTLLMSGAHAVWNQRWRDGERTAQVRTRPWLTWPSRAPTNQIK